MNSESASQPVAFEVYSPVGAVQTGRTPAPRVDTLAGKTICEQWNGTFRGNDTFPVIRELLQKQFPDAKIVPYTDLPITHATAEQIQKAVKQKGCDVFIGGNGG